MCIRDRMTYGWVRMPDAMVRYALASSSKLTSEAPNAVVAYGRKGVRMPRVRAVSRTLATPICSVTQTATAFRDSASAMRRGMGPLNCCLLYTSDAADDLLCVD